MDSGDQNTSESIAREKKGGRVLGHPSMQCITTQF